MACNWHHKLRETISNQFVNNGCEVFKQYIYEVYACVLECTLFSYTHTHNAMAWNMGQTFAMAA